MEKTLMSHRFILLAFAAVLLFFPGCSTESDEGTALCETPGERYCDGPLIQECSTDYEWETVEDCSASDRTCENGQCISPSEFRATRLPVPGELHVDIPGELECGQAWLIPFFASRQDETADYEIGFGAAERLRTSPESSARLSMSFDGATSPLPARTLGQWAFDRYNRERAEFLWENRGKTSPEIRRRSQPMASGCTKSAECATDEICNEGQCASSVTLYFDAWTISTTLTAGVAAKGASCAVLLDESDASSVSQSALDDLLNACENVIVPRSHLFFGEPEFTVDGKRLDVSDRDEDGLLQVLMSSKVNEENVWGFFASADFFDSETDYPSNERDIVYISVPEDSSEIPVIQATIIHEYQHLLHFAGHAWGPWISGDENADMSPVWLDEAMAHLSEEIGGYGVDNILLVNEVLKVINTTSLSFGEDDLMRRGMGLMFMLYLFEQAGGVEYSLDRCPIRAGRNSCKPLFSLEKTDSKPWRKPSAVIGTISCSTGW